MRAGTQKKHKGMAIRRTIDTPRVIVRLWLKGKHGRAMTIPSVTSRGFIEHTAEANVVGSA